jgi:hypothetical protein
VPQRAPSGLSATFCGVKQFNCCLAALEPHTERFLKNSLEWYSAGGVLLAAAPGQLWRLGEIPQHTMRHHAVGHRPVRFPNRLGTVVLGESNGPHRASFRWSYVSLRRSAGRQVVRQLSESEQY